MSDTYRTPFMDAFEGQSLVQALDSTWSDELGEQMLTRRVFEPLGDGLRRRLLVIGVEAFSFYGTTELGGTAGECEQHDGLHVQDDWILPTLRDPEEVEPVERSYFNKRKLRRVLDERSDAIDTLDSSGIIDELT